MNTDDMLMVGIITTTHGVRGEVKVLPTTDDPARFKKLKKVFLYNGKEVSETAIQSVKLFKQFVIIKLEGTDDMNAAQLLRNHELYVTRDKAVKCDDDEYFIADLVDMDVYTDEGELFGKLVKVYQTGANDVYEVEREDGSTVLFPAIKECVKEVNVKEKRMTVHVMDGLI